MKKNEQNAIDDLLAECFTGDVERDHVEADRILCQLLTTLGYTDLVRVYNKVEKRYARLQGAKPTDRRVERSRSRRRGGEVAARIRGDEVQRLLAPKGDPDYFSGVPGCNPPSHAHNCTCKPKGEEK